MLSLIRYTALRLAVMTVVTRCQILRLTCTKFDFGWGSAPDPAWGAYSVPPNPVAGFKGPTSKGREGSGGGRDGSKEGRMEREGKGKGGRRGGRGKGGLAPRS